MYTVLILTTLLGVALGYSAFAGGLSGGGWGGGLVVSRRDADSEKLYKLIKDTLDEARKGIKANDLKAAAAKIQALADAILDSKGGEVPVEDTQEIIDKIAATFNGQTAVSALFDDPLQWEASKLDAALCLLDKLVDAARELEAAGKPADAAIAAISITAKALQTVVDDSLNIIVYLAKAGPAKRWEFKGSVEKGPGGTSYKGEVSHKWGGRRFVRRDLNRRGEWGGKVSAGYDSRGGLSVGGSVSYSWGRR